MRVEKFKVSEQGKISNLILKKYPQISYNQIMKLFRNKDIKINNKRISKNETVNAGDEIIFYISETFLETKLDIIYQDENIVIINKPRKMEVENETELSAVKVLSKQIGEEVFAVHRLDRNTTGLLIFAKNINAKNSLDKALKERTLDKLYLALVYGNPTKKQDDMIAYLKKDSKKSEVIISDFPQKGFEKIETSYKIIKNCDILSLIEVKLVTGKTHQIRAHFAHVNCPLLGDEKYGRSEINKNFKVKYQCLIAYKIKFNFNKNDYLYYLNGKEIILNNEKIDFLKFCK